MNFDDLFETFRHTTLHYPVQRPKLAPRKQKLSNASKPTYTFDSISQLIGDLRALPLDPHDSDYTLSIRYLVQLDGTLILAREGKPCSNIPAHREMGGFCLAAGNIFFNKSYTEIIAINNQSGDFRPSASCLVWAIKGLLRSGFKLSDDFTVRVYQNDDRFDIPLNVDQQQQILALPLEMPKSWISHSQISLFSPRSESLASSPAKASSSQSESSAASAAASAIKSDDETIVGTKRKLDF